MEPEPGSTSAHTGLNHPMFIIRTLTLHICVCIMQLLKVSRLGEETLSKNGNDTSSRIQTVTEAATALFRLGRLFSRLPTLNVVAPRNSRETMLSAIHTAQAVDEATSSGEIPTVGALADRLAVDPSTASRQVTHCVRRGYLRRATRQSDGRAVALDLTDAGKELVNDARRYQRAVFERVTDDWTNDEREEFARLFVRFAASIAAMHADMVGHDSDDDLNPVPK